jgi:RND family efflux transporter MFP subunit
MKLFKTLNTKVEYSELEVAEKNLEVAEVNKKTTEMLINESTLFSPINGVVSKINRYEGELINSGSSGNSPILTVMDTSNLFVTISINEKDLSKFKRGQENKILVDSLPDNVYFGKIVRISPSVDPRTHTTEIKIEIKNKNQELRPGMFVRAETVLGEKVESLLVPIEAVLLNSEKTGFAFIAKGTNIFKTEIKIKEKIGDKYSIESGVVPNDFVAVTNLGRLVDGSPIIPRIKK